MSLIQGYEKDEMSALDRLLATVTGKETDRIPIYPMIDALPAQLFGISTEDYYSKAENVVKGQNKLQDLFNLDYVSNFFYLALETELFGMESMFFENGSPNAGEPAIGDVEYFTSHSIPEVAGHPAYEKSLLTTKNLAEKYKGEKPILSVQTAPFSLPSMLMGSSQWFESILMYPDRVPDVLKFTTDFAVQWAKGQLDAGADVVVVVDGVATATSIPKEVFKQFVIPIYQDLNERLGAPIVFYTAGGAMLPFADILHETGVVGVFPSANDDLGAFNERAAGKYTIFGNVNNLEMGDWPNDFMEKVVEQTISAGKPGGKYSIATQHMIPHGVSKEQIATFISLCLRYAYH